MHALQGIRGAAELVQLIDEAIEESKTSGSSSTLTTPSDHGRSLRAEGSTIFLNAGHPPLRSIS